MKLDSPLFNRIRVKPVMEPRPRADMPACEWPGCVNAGTHRAPKGRLREREYWRFCLDHVRDYNQSYNYFAGMSEDAVARYQKDAVTGHRPTWKMGLNGATDRFHGGEMPSDPFDARVRRRPPAPRAPEAGSAADPQCRAQGLRYARA